MGDDSELVLDAGADHGEGPSWDPVTRRLIWVDITAGEVHRFDPATGHDEVFPVGQAAGVAVPADDGRLLVGVQRGLGLLDVPTGDFTMVADVEAGDDGTRINDGKVDPGGRFFVGTMAWDGQAGRGSLYRVDPGFDVSTVVTGTAISNGVDWSPDRTRMYYIDSPEQRVDVFDYDVDTGSVSGRRPAVASTGDGDAVPDGMCVDAEGYLWVAFWGGAKVERFAPDGRLDGRIDLPALQPTSCTFGGPNLDELYITSARHDMDAEALRRYPASGGLFRVRPGVRGQEGTPFRR